MAKARIGGAESLWVTRNGIVIHDNCTSRHEPYPKRSKRSNTKRINYTEYNDPDIESETNVTPDTNDGDPDFQPDDHDEISDVESDSDDAANEDIWPEQFPVKEDIMKFERYCKQTEPFQVRKERLTEKQRNLLWGRPEFEHILVAWRYIKDDQLHIWLPSAFDKLGRPYEKTCDRVWKSWRRYERDMFANAIPSVEEIDSECPTPVTLEFPKRRYRHPKKGTRTAVGSSDASSISVASSSPAPSSTPASSISPSPIRRQKSKTSERGLRCSGLVRNQLSEDLLTSLLVKLGRLHADVLSDEDEEQLRIESEEALRRIREEQDKVLLDLRKSLIKFQKSKRV